MVTVTWLKIPKLTCLMAGVAYLRAMLRVGFYLFLAAQALSHCEAGSALNAGSEKNRGERFRV